MATETIDVQCKNCNKINRAPVHAAGKRGKCAGCGSVLQVPELSAAVIANDSPSIDNNLNPLSPENVSKELKSNVNGRHILAVIIVIAVAAFLIVKQYGPVSREQSSQEALEQRMRALDQQALRERKQKEITLQKYNQIETGMTLAEVNRVLGPGTEISRVDLAGTTAVMYSWQNADGANMNATLQNDRVIQKAQFGLK